MHAAARALTTTNAQMLLAHGATRCHARRVWPAEKTVPWIPIATNLWEVATSALTKSVPALDCAEHSAALTLIALGDALLA